MQKVHGPPPRQCEFFHEAGLKFSPKSTMCLMDRVESGPIIEGDYTCS